jgi:hypothetical protein
MGVDVTAFESTGIYPLNCKRAPEYFFSISDTSETVTFMETTPPIGLICAPSQLSKCVTYPSRTFLM